jgi:hypothetical protein
MPAEASLDDLLAKCRPRLEFGLARCVLRCIFSEEVGSQSLSLGRWIPVPPPPPVLSCPVAMALRHLRKSAEGPAERYVRAVVTRGTADATIHGVIAILYGPRVLPVTQDATVAGIKTKASPEEGTA